MVREMFRFGKEAKEHLPLLDEQISLGDYLKQNNYSHSFAQDYLLPMTAAVWSVPVSGKTLDHATSIFGLTHPRFL
jgi:predicted NAD/FAD-binding protein